MVRNPKKTTNAVKEFNLRHHNSETMLFGIYPSDYGYFKEFLNNNSEELEMGAQVGSARAAATPYPEASSFGSSSTSPGCQAHSGRETGLLLRNLS